ncbi:MAG: hypothetical protein J5822_08660 [Eubacteriaceae bacterium]|nr:hypothetical protein [Eubacteriaceae bacterium]
MNRNAYDPDDGKGRFYYYAFLGVLTASALAAAFILYRTYDPGEWTTWFWTGWIAVSLLAGRCFVNGKWDRLENMLGPVAEDIGMLMFVIVPVIGIVYGAYELAVNGMSDNPLLTLIFMTLFLAFDIIMIKRRVMTFNFIDRIKESIRRNEKDDL